MGILQNPNSYADVVCVVCVPIHPGFVASEMSELCNMFPETYLNSAQIVANICAKDESLRVFQAAAITPEESAAGLVRIIEESSREKHGGESCAYDGSRLAW